MVQFSGSTSVFTAVGGWLTRRLRKAMGGAWSKPNMLSRKRFWRMGPLDAANARYSVAEEQSGEQETATTSDVDR